MNFRSKYVIMNTAGSPVPFVFSELSTHAEVAKALGGEVLGAGFCYIKITDHKYPLYVCYGESVSLKVKSREEVDADIINRLLGLTEYC